MQINTVAYNEGHTVELENKLFLGDAISDLPEVSTEIYVFLLFVFFLFIA